MVTDTPPGPITSDALLTLNAGRALHKVGTKAGLGFWRANIPETELESPVEDMNDFAIKQRIISSAQMQGNGGFKMGKLTIRLREILIRAYPYG